MTSKTPVKNGPHRRKPALKSAGGQAARTPCELEKSWSATSFSKASRPPRRRSSSPSRRHSRVSDVPFLLLHLLRGRSVIRPFS